MCELTAYKDCLCNMALSFCIFMLTQLLWATNRWGKRKAKETTGEAEAGRREMAFPEPDTKSQLARSAPSCGSWASISRCTGLSVFILHTAAWEMTLSSSSLSVSPSIIFVHLYHKQWDLGQGVSTDGLLSEFMQAPRGDRMGFTAAVPCFLLLGSQLPLNRFLPPFPALSRLVSLQ